MFSHSHDIQCCRHKDTYVEAIKYGIHVLNVHEKRSDPYVKPKYLLILTLRTEVHLQIIWGLL